MYKYYRNKCVVTPPSEQRKILRLPRDKHATISVISHKEKDFAGIDDYLADCERQYEVEYLKQSNYPTERAWKSVMSLLNAQYNNRGKNIVLECLQFGGNKEFWNGFPDEEEIYMYFRNCYYFAVKKIGYLRTDKNIICSVIVTEQNRRNLFVYYLPVTEKWQVKVMSNDRSERGNKLQQLDEYGEPIYLKRYNTTRPRLSHSEFWKQRGGLTSYSDLQEQFFNEVSERYGAKRGESFSLIKNTSLEQRERFNRSVGDDYDDLYFDDLPYG